LVIKCLLVIVGSEAMGSGQEVKPDRSVRPVRFKSLPCAWLPDCWW